MNNSEKPEKRFGPGSFGPSSSFMHFQHAYIEGLGLTNSMMTKYTLDIAAGDSNYASHVGDHVISIDSAANSVHQMSMQNAQIDAEDLPFHDDEFEMIISSQGLPFLYHIAYETDEERQARRDETYDHTSIHDISWEKNLTRENVESKTSAFLNESLRVLKPGGQIRCWPLYEYPAKIATLKYKEMLDAKLELLKQENKIDFKYEETESGEDDDGNLMKIFRLIITKK